MVEVTVRVRPKNGYHYPNKIKTVKLESHTRLEELLKQIDHGGASSSSSAASSAAAAGGSSRSSPDNALYLFGRELPLNSSIASHNLDDGVILETCKSPAISAVITSVLKDFDDIKRIPEHQRTREKLMTILQVPPHLQQQEEETDENESSSSFWDIKKWDDEAIKNRTICLATMKKIIQKDDRYNAIDIPCCSDIPSLHKYIQPALERSNAGSDNSSSNGRKRWNSIGNLFTHSTKRNGKPSTVYTLLEHKLSIQIQIAADFVSTENGGSEDPIEEFVRIDSLRHGGAGGAGGGGTEEKVSGSRRRRGVGVVQSQSSSTHSNPTTGINNVGVRSPPNTPTKSKQPYCPQYASGPFAILCTLFEAQLGQHKNANNGRRLLSLSENQLKVLAQPRCRSNLYDRQIMRGSRNAFTCMESMAKRNFVRKEIIRDGEERWALLPDGNKVAEACLAFEKAVGEVLPCVDIHGDGCSSSKDDSDPNETISLIVDNREDVHYRERLMNECRDNGIGIEEKQLPAGDYLFMQNENVIPLVIERKSWSDLADSVLARGRAHRRLDCVRIGTDYATCPRQNCQLCKMKRSGCTQVMFIIEGARCRGSDLHNSSCNDRQQCQACKALMERHGSKVTQESLEIVLNRLQAEHGCYVHFTQSYNQTITSLFAIREILSDSNCYANRMMQFVKSKKSTNSELGSKNTGIPYERFSSNVGNSISDRSHANYRNGDILEWKSEFLIRFILENLNQWQAFLHEELIQTNNDSGRKESRKRSADTNIDVVHESNSSKRQRNNGDLNKSIEIVEINETHDESDVEVIDSSDDESSVELLKTASACVESDDIIELNDSQDSIQIVGIHAPSSSQSMAREQSINRFKADCSDTNCLLMINDMEYLEVKLMKDLNDKWQECYRIYDTSGASSFYDSAVAQLSEMITSGSYPYLVSNSFMKVILWVQIKLGLRVRAVCRQKIVADLKDRWIMSSSQNSKSPQNESNEVLASRPMESNPGATSQRPPTSPAAISCRQSHNFNLDYQSSTSKHRSPPSDKRAAAIEARLRRFGNMKQESTTYSSCKDGSSVLRKSKSSLHSNSKAVNSTSDIVNGDVETWKCDTCTYLNTINRTECEMCTCTRTSYTNSEGDAIMHAIDVSHTGRDWSFPSYSNDNSSVYPNFIQSSSLSSSYSNDMASLKPETRTSKIKCGACGLEGHNRASANSDNCPAYYQEDEIRRREEKQRKIREKAIVAEQEYQALQEEEARVQLRQEELKRQIEEMNRDLLRTSEIRTAEIERRRKKAMSARRKADREGLL
eukprot:CAMPEP_0176491706 /NCGR_PEP_ID=MMETSP0200_2-20121128/8579_1 /TAXON_ID=947934 /ORGANISM="Chaetoceros sp., Strain GSL56" /LENGTH=1292 /DNA_ID=CAMNT_0017889161 /DNA_START=126 /DNA_END=4004 /DNA_ORIENTATION=-